jgi:hypothetical protein
MRSKRLAISVVLAMAPGLAAADEPVTDRARAEHHFLRGRELVRQGRCGDAVTELRASAELEPSVGAYLNLGDCLLKLDRREEAWRAYKEAERLAQRKGDERLAKIREDAARVAASAVRVILRAPEDAVDLYVTVDGRAVPRERLAEILVSPDAVHEIEASAAKKSPWRSPVNASAGTIARLEIAFIDAPAPPAAAQPLSERVGEPGPREIAPPTAYPLRPWGIAVGAVGAGALVTGAVFGVLALGSRDDLQSAVAAEPSCRGSYPEGVCDRSARGRLDPLESRATAQATLSTIFVAVGGAMIATGVVLALWPARHAPRTARIGGYAHPGAAGAIYQTSW